MFYSPLRYPGGKGRISPWFVELMRRNNISGGSYIEPYAGGSGVALHLIIKGYVNHIHINDNDIYVYDFWHEVLNNSSKFCQWIQSIDISMSTWEHAREILHSGRRTKRIERARAFFFLNRVNRSGIVNGGLIGGRNQSGIYKMGARFNREELVKRIRRIARYKNQITLTKLDAAELITRLSKKKIDRGLIYLDPPYYKEGGNLYLNSYDDGDHVLISQLVKKLKSPWILTYDNHPRIKELYSWAKQSNMPVRYTAQTRRVENELLYYNNISLS